MKSVSEIDNQIQQESEIVSQLYAKIRLAENSVANLIKEREEAAKYECNNFIDDWLKKTFGIPNQKEARNGMFIVFDKDANFIETVTCGYGQKYHYVSPATEKDTLEHWLRDNKYYAHCASSFCGRNREWYEMSFKEQLKNLTWEFNKEGKLIKTQW